MCVLCVSYAFSYVVQGFWQEPPLIFPGDHSISLAAGPVPGCRCISPSLAAERRRQKCCHGGRGIGGGRCRTLWFFHVFFPECVAKGSRFTFLGVWGWRRVRVTLLLVSATVRNGPCATVVAEKLACLWGKPQKRVFLDVSEDVLMSFCVAGVALCDTEAVKQLLIVNY